MVLSILAISLAPLVHARPLDLEELLKMDIVDLAQVQIEVASRRLESVATAPSVINVVTAKDIEGFGANNLVDILNRVTSVQAIGSHFYSHSISMRGQMVGHSNNDILFLINGRPHRTSWNGGTPERLLMAFPIQTIERIEIIRGPGSVLYGTGAFTGVINIITKTAKKQKDALGITLGSRSNNGGGSSAPFSSRGFNISTTYDSETADISAGFKMFDSDGWTYTATDEQGVTDSVQRSETNIGAMLTADSGGFSMNVL
jgi:outer membrane receptor for ferrienterochelin and colicin